MNVPNRWEHVSGYYLNADGKSLTYEHTDRDLTGYVEAEVEPDVGLVFRAYIMDADDTFEVYPEKFEDKDDAKERLRQHMEYYS